MLREIITIDEDLCNGCGNCIPGCPEGALQIIDNKARLVSDLMCDGLGACVGECPTGAMKVIKREAEAYDEKKVMANIVLQGANTIKAHLTHLSEHGEKEFLAEAIEYLTENDIDIPDFETRRPQPVPQVKVAHHHHEHGHGGGGCPGSRMIEFADDKSESADVSAQAQSALRQWPVQLTLLNPQAPYFKECDLVVAADCVAYSLGNFHAQFLKGKSLAIFCPKLDSTLDQYLEKLIEIFRTQNVKSVTTVKMEVPCCGGTRQIVERAIQLAGVDLKVDDYTVSLQGKVY